MVRARIRVAVAAMAVLSLASVFAPASPRASADPFLTNNPDGTSTAVWNFTNLADYTFTDTEASPNNATLARQPVFWWNSTTAADFAGPDSETNIDRATWPGDVTMASHVGPQTFLSLQPGAAGEDTYLDRANQNTNCGAATTMLLDGRNPQYHPLLRFDLSSIPANAVIDGAVLNLYQSAGIGNPVTANLHHVTAPWNELQATWQDRLTGVPWLAGGGDYGTRLTATLTLTNVAGWRAWNITTLVDLWYRGRLTNDGLIIEAPQPGATSVKTFYSSDYNVNPALRPRLDITYRILGATSEYISRVGGPGTLVAWKTLSWNSSVRDFASDEFNGSSLDPKWSWTNPPAYDVGTTTPGSLHVVSTTGTDLTGTTFTGNVLSQGIVGDFTATMKLSENPTAAGQRAGLMVLANSRNWYAVGKANVGGGARNWRVYGVDDGITTIRTDVASTNPVPAWLRIGRTGTTFTAWTSNDGIAWTLRDTYAPPFEYPLGARLAFFVTDGLSGIALPVDVDYIRIDTGNDASVTVQTRTGDVTPVDGTWMGWSAPYPNRMGSAMSGSSMYVDYRLSFSVWNPAHMPVISDVNLSWFRYAAAGTVDTNDLVPTDLSAWGDFSVVSIPNGQTIAYAYSLDSGGTWTPVVPPAGLQSVSIASGKIRFRASMSTTNTLVTPELHELRFTYTHRLDHFYVSAPPTAVAGLPFTVTVTAKDALNATLTAWTGTVTLAARLADGVTPGGGVLGVTTLAIVAGGTATLNTETYTMAEPIRILATFGTATGLSDLITITPSSIDHIVVTPADVTLLAFDSQGFAAWAYDRFNNTIAGVNFTWAVGGGVGTLNVTWGPAVLFTSNPPAANGTLQASFLTISGTALIHVTLGTPPWVSIAYPASNAHVTGVVPIAYTNSSDSLSLDLEYDDGTGWTLIGSTAVLNGTYYWNTAGLNFVGGRLAALVTNNRTAVGSAVVSPIEVDNTPPTITIDSVVDDQAGSGTLTLLYTTDADVVRVDFTYFDGAWNAIGSDFTIDGSYVWTPGVGINGVTVRAVAYDEVNLSGATERPGVGSYLGPNPPSIAAIPDLHVLVASTYRLNLTFYLSDPDTPISALGISVSDPANVTANMGPYPSLDVTYAAIGTYLVTLWVSDGASTAWTIVRVIASANGPPNQVASLPWPTFDEDTTAWNALAAPTSSFFSDPDLDPLAFTVLDGVNIFARVNANDTIDLWAGANWYGSEWLRLRATDPSGGFAEGPFVVTVRPVNDAPVLVTAFAAVAFDEDTTSLDVFGGDAHLHFFDVDLDALTVTVLGGVNVFSRVNANGTIDLWSAANWYGSETLRVRATDPSGAFAEGPFVVTVRPVNDAPVLVTAFAAVAFDEDTTSFDVFGGDAALHFFDVDGDSLTLTVLGGVNVFSRVNANGTIDLWSAANWSGSETLRVRATDPSGAFAEGPFVVTVRPVNDAPILLNAFTAVTFNEDVTATDVFGGDAALHFFDVDGDPLTLAVVGGTQVSARVNPSGTIDLWGSPNWYGSENLVVRAADPSGAFADGPFVATVLPVNDAPVVTSALPSVAFDEDTTAFNVFSGPASTHFFDVDGDPLTLTISGASQVQSRMNGDGTVDLWAAANWSGTETLTVRAEDPSGAFAELPFSVLVRPVNDAPLLAPLPALKVDQGTTYTLDLTPYISDIDTPLGNITVTTDNTYVTVRGHVLSLSFPKERLDDVTFNVRISDGALGASSPLRVSFIPVWWRSQYMLGIPVLAWFLVVSMIVQRARWRPAKAFLVDDRKQMLREFTLDPKCDVTFEQAVGAGALDAVEKPVKVSRYHAQTVRGDALALTLLALGPVTEEQIEYAREMLVNVQDKFEDRVKERLEEVRTAEASFAAERTAIDQDRAAVASEAQASQERLEAAMAAEAKVAEENASVAEKFEELDRREASVREHQAAFAEREHAIDIAQADLEKRLAAASETEASVAQRVAAADEREGRIAAIEEDLAPREQEVHAKEASLRQREERVAAQDAELAALRRDLESRETSLKGQEAASGEQARALDVRQTELAARFNRVKEQESDVTARAEDLESRETQLASLQEEIGSREQSLEGRESQIGSREAGIAAREKQVTARETELTSIYHRLESRDAAVKEQESALAEQVRSLEAREAEVANRVAGIESREAAVATRTADLEEQGAQAASLEAELASREKSLQEREALLGTREAGIQAREERVVAKEADLGALRQAIESQTADVAARETALAERVRSLEDREADLTERITDVERKEAASAARAADLEAQRTQLASQEAEAASRLKSVDEREATVGTREAEVQSREDRLAGKTAELDAFRSDLDNRKAALDEETAGLQAARDALAAERREFDTKSAQLAEDAARQKREFEAQARSLQDLQQHLTSERESFQLTRAEKLGWIADKERVLEDKARSAEEREAAIARHEADVHAREERTAARDAELANLRSDLESREAALAQDRQGLAAATDALARDREEFEAGVARFEAESKRRAGEMEAQARALQDRQDRFAKDTKTFEASRAEELRIIGEKIMELDSKTRVCAEREASVTGRETEVQDREEWIAAKEAELTARQEDIEARETALAKEKNAVSAATEALTRERAEFDRRSLQFAQETQRRSEALESQTRSLSEFQVKLENERQDFEGTREAKLAWIAEKDMDLETKAQSLAEREAEVIAQAEANGKQLADLAAREEEHEVEGDRLEKLKRELDARKTDLDAAVKGLDARAAEVRDLEARKAEEFRKWTTAMESQQALQKQLQDAFEKESAAARQALADRAQRLRASEKAAADREAKARASIEWAMRHEDEAKLKEEAAAEVRRVAEAKLAEAETARGDLARRATELEGREQSVRAEAQRLEETLGRRSESLAAEQSALEERRKDFEGEVTDREAHLRDAEGELARRKEAAEEKAAILVTREAQIANQRGELDQDRADLEGLRKELESREISLNQVAQRNEEEAARLREESRTLQESTATREAEILAHQERVARESQNLQETLGVKAQELAAREAALAAKERDTLARTQGAETRTREVEFREREAARQAEALAAREASITRIQKDFEARSAQLDAAMKQFAAEQERRRGEWTAADESLRTREAQAKSENDKRTAALAAKETELERREREANSLRARIEQDQSRLGDTVQASTAAEARAKEAFARSEARIGELRALEAESLKARQAFEAERAAWEQQHGRERTDLEALRTTETERTQAAERLLEEAQRRAGIAAEAERSAARKLEELTSRQAQLDARRAEVENAERSLQAQTIQIQDASRKLAGRELEIETMSREFESRQAKLEARSREMLTARGDLRTQRETVEAERRRLEKLAKELDRNRSDADAKAAEADSRATRTTELEKSLQRRETEVLARERALSPKETEVAKREEALAERESAVRSGQADLERQRLEVDQEGAKADELSRSAAAMRSEAEALRKTAEKEKAQADAQLAEVSKTMKFLQQKAVDVLDKEEAFRKREVEAEERERILEGRFEIVETKEQSIELEREESRKAVAALEAEVARLKAQLAEASKGGQPSPDLEARNRDLENRLKIIQRKAMELLDREETLRKRETEMKEKAERLRTSL